MSYQPVPLHEHDPSYPPIRPSDTLGPPYALKSNRRHRWWTAIKWIAGLLFSLLVLHYAILGAWPHSSYAAHFRDLDDSTVQAEYVAASTAAEAMLEQLDPAAGQPGTFFRDAHPIRSMLAFWELAEKEVKAKNLDTCHGQLSTELIDAYHQSQMAYCLPRGSTAVQLASNGTSGAETRIWCMPVQRNAFSKWWPYPAAPCLSTNIRAVQDSERKFVARGCEITDDGVHLQDEMKRERFLGSDLESVESDLGTCKDVLDRTVIIIGRQDQWNP